jgi:hypothetical protein
MARALSFVALIVASGLISSCGGAGGGVPDPEGLVRFSVPAGWEVRSEANGTRLGRIEPASERTVLMVAARPLQAGRTPESLRERRVAQIKAQNGELTIDRMGKRSGVISWESLHESPPTSSRPWMHAIHLFPKGLHVEVALIASPDKYANYVPDLEAVAGSIKAL